MIRKIISIIGFIIAMVCTFVSVFLCFAEAAGGIPSDEYYSMLYPWSNATVVGLAMMFAWRWWE